MLSWKDLASFESFRHKILNETTKGFSHSVFWEELKGQEIGIATRECPQRPQRWPPWWGCFAHPDRSIAGSPTRRFVWICQLNLLTTKSWEVGLQSPKSMRIASEKSGPSTWTAEVYIKHNLCESQKLYQSFQTSPRRCGFAVSGPVVYTSDYLSNWATNETTLPLY